jgi:hypothetical protein
MTENDIYDGICKGIGRQPISRKYSQREKIPDGKVRVIGVLALI